MILHVRLTPKGGADRIDGWSLDPEGRSVLAVRVRAAPIEGEANAALEQLAVSSSAVRVARGGQSRFKAVEVDGVDLAAVEAALGKGKG